MKFEKDQIYQIDYKDTDSNLSYKGLGIFQDERENFGYFNIGWNEICLFPLDTVFKIN